MNILKNLFNRQKRSRPTDEERAVEAMAQGMKAIEAIVRDADPKTAEARAILFLEELQALYAVVKEIDPKTAVMLAETIEAHEGIQALRAAGIDFDTQSRLVPLLSQSHGRTDLYRAARDVHAPGIGLDAEYILFRLAGNSMALSMYQYKNTLRFADEFAKKPPRPAAPGQG